jgi:hypothetical protein
MKGMSSDSAEVRAMLQALAPKMRGCKESLSAQAVGDADDDDNDDDDCNDDDNDDDNDEL